MSYATVEELEARWRPLDDSESAQAEVLLGDASAIVGAALEHKGIDEEDINPIILVHVVCKMVKRSMGSADGPDGVATTQLTQGPFSQSFNFVNPQGDLYMTKQERKMLGLDRQRIGVIMPKIGYRHDSR